MQAGSAQLARSAPSRGPSRSLSGPAGSQERECLVPIRAAARLPRLGGSGGERLRARHVARRARSPSDAEFEGVEGDALVQSALEDQLRLQLKSEVIKESIRDDLRSKVEEVQKMGEELQAELDEGYRIEKFRNDIESQEALASAMDKFDELEDEIAAMKQQIQADREELALWERASAAARSKGLFFKNLYTPEADATAGGGAAGAATAGSGKWGGELRGSLDPEAAAAARAAAAKITAPAEEEVGSPMRLWLFAYMAAVLAIVVGQDLMTGAPSLGLDALYGTLGLILGFNAYSERQLLATRQRERAAAEQQQQQQQPPQ